MRQALACRAVIHPSAERFSWPRRAQQYARRGKSRPVVTEAAGRGAETPRFRRGRERWLWNSEATTGISRGVFVAQERNCRGCQATYSEPWCSIDCANRKAYRGAARSKKSSRIREGANSARDCSLYKIHSDGISVRKIISDTISGWRQTGTP